MLSNKSINIGMLWVIDAQLLGAYFVQLLVVKHHCSVRVIDKKAGTQYGIVVFHNAIGKSR